MNSTNAPYQRAVVLHAQGRYADAERELRQALAQEPEHPGAHAMLALCLLHRDAFAEATAEAQQAVGVAPYLPFAHYVMAFTLYKRNRLPEAMAGAEQAVALEPDNPDFHALVAAVHLEARRWAAALAAAERGLSYDAEHVQCANLRARALVMLGRRDEAGATMDATLRLSPEDAHSHANRGWALLHEGKPREAMEHFRESLRLDPTSDWARGGIVEALKARFFVYRWLLAYFLWMTRLSPRAQWGVMLGGYFGYQFLRQASETNAALRPYVLPVMIAYGVFVVMTWLAYPLFNLLLRLSRFGRLALSRRQTVEANVVGLLLLAGLVSFVVGVLTRSEGAEVLGLVLALMVVPATGPFKVDRGWPTVVAIAAAAVLTAIGLATAGLLFALPHAQEAARPILVHWANQLVRAFSWGVLISIIGRHFLVGVRVRR